MQPLRGQAAFAELLRHALAWLECQIWDESDKVRPPKDGIWFALSDVLQGNMSPKYVYQVLKTNRWNVAEQHRRLLFCNLTESAGSPSPAEEEDEVCEGSDDVSKRMPGPVHQLPPILYNIEVYNKAKKEAREGALNLTKSETVMQNIKIMKHNIHLGSIHDIGDDPIKVTYVTPEQILLNNNLQKQGWYVMQLEATGPYCTRLTLLHGLSGKIILYEFLSSTAKGTAQLCQMLTEKRDAVTIASWIDDWQQRGALAPNEVICDGSPALISALTRTFGGCKSTKKYREICFSYLLQNSQKLPSCFVRIGYVYFIRNVAKWKLWNEVEDSFLRDHFIRFIILLVRAESLDEFSTKLIAILTVALAQTAGQDRNGNITPAEKAFKQLVSDVSADELLPLVEQEVVDPGENQAAANDTDPENIKEWLNEIKKVASQNAVVVGSSINTYYNKDYANKLIEEASSFLHWSSVMVEPFGAPDKVAHTVAMEGHFFDLKRRVLHNEAMPMKLNVFIHNHLNSINGQNIILASNEFKRSAEQTETSKTTESKTTKKSKKSTQTSHHDSSATLSEHEEDVFSDLRRSENRKDSDRFRGPSPKITGRDTRPSRKRNASESPSKNGRSTDSLNTSSSKKKKPNNLEKNTCDTSSVDQHGNIKQPQNLILKNGNLSGFLQIEGIGKCCVKNTCSFDAVVQVFTCAYIDLRNFRAAVDLQKDDVPSLELVSLLAMNGATGDAYQKRAALLIPMSHLQQTCNVKNKKRTGKSRAKSQVVEYTLAKLQNSESIEESRLPNGNLEALLNLIFKDFPSRVTKYVCSSGHTKEETAVTLSPNFEHLLTAGIEHLQDSLEFGMEPVAQKCHECDLVATGTVSCLDVLLVTVDILNEKGPYSSKITLEQIPCSLSLRNKDFVLVGLVSYAQSRQHYVAVVRRLTSQWETIDDCVKNINPAEPTDSVVPHLLFYVRKPQQA